METKEKNINLSVFEQLCKVVGHLKFAMDLLNVLRETTMQPIVKTAGNPIYSKMSLLRPPDIKITSLLRPVFTSPKWHFPYDNASDIKTISLIRPLLGSRKGGLKIGILLYMNWLSVKGTKGTKWTKYL